jgi:hypothetical protein
MLTKVIRIDENGSFVEDIWINSEDPVPYDCIAIEVPEGLYKPRWLNGEWTEGLSQEEIDAIRNVPVPEPIEQKAQRLESENADLREQLAATNENVESLTNALIELGVI